MPTRRCPPPSTEARGLRVAYERSLAARDGRTAVGRTGGPDDVPATLAALCRIAEGTPYKEAGLPGGPIESVMDVQAYYEEAALALADHVPAARSGQAWFFRETEAGRVVLAAQRSMREAGARQPLWFYMVPATL